MSAATTSAGSAGWILTGRRATDPRPTPAAVIDLDVPRHGIMLPDGRSDRLLGLDVGPACGLSDHWLRGRDVTAVYESADARQLRTTAMWRQHPSPAGTTAWELVASAQTSLLAADSALAVVSEVGAADVLWGTCHDGACQWRPSHAADATCVLLTGVAPAPTSVLVAVHPDEAGGISVERQGGRVRVACRLFANTLEKGVLLRSRVLAAIGPAGDERGWAETLLAEFASAPPLLTT